LSDYYKTEDTITALGIGEALVTALNEKGIPTPLAATMLRSPMSRMDILTSDEINSINRASELVSKYNQTIDRESAYEILGKKVEAIEKEKSDEAAQDEWEKKQKEMAREGGGGWGRTTPRTSGTSRSRRSTVSPVVKVLTSATFIRGVMGILRKVM
ncbi:MAG: DUF853 family protein, partial [Bacteroidia bacterium]|nr:DUF853 family protein [Bacteroidia bacterium]